MADGRVLTTQLYFEGDEFNPIDPYNQPALIMTGSDRVFGFGKVATFDFVLAPYKPRLRNAAAAARSRTRSSTSRGPISLSALISLRPKRCG